MLPLRIRLGELIQRLSADPQGLRRLVALGMVLALIGTLVATDNLSLHIGPSGGAATQAEGIAQTGDTAATGDLGTGEGAGGTTGGGGAAAGSGGGGGTLAAGTGGGGGPSARTGGAAARITGTPRASCAGARLRATDRGVTAQKVDIALFSVDLAALEAVGFGLSTGEVNYGEIVNAWTKEINSHGGIACRKLNLVHVVGQLEENDQVAKCRAMSQDMKVFGVLSPGGNIVGGPCLAKEEKTPIVTALAAPEKWKREGAPYMWDILMSQEQYMRNQVRWLVSSRDVRPGNPNTAGVTRLGIVYADENYSGISVEQAMIPELKRLGVTPVRVAKLPYDSGQAASQVPQVVVDFQTSNVDTVIMPMNLIYKTQFMQQADQQGYRPRYRDADYTVSCQTFTTSTYPENQWDGTKCVSSGGYAWTAPNGLNQAELEKYIAANAFAKYADRVYRNANPGGYSNGGERNEDDTQAQRSAHYVTGELLLLLAQAADRVGPNLTRKAWGAAMGQTTSFKATLGQHPLSFGPNKHSGPNFLHIVQWEKDAGSGYEARSYRKLLPWFRAWY